MARMLFLLAAIPAAQAAGACSSDDLSKITALPQDTSDGGFGGKSAACGRKAFSLISGFNTEKFDTCLMGDIAISHDCADCYAQAGKYSASNCKADCLLGWCKSGCLTCSKSAADTAATCAGVPSATLTPCDASFDAIVQSVNAGGHSWKAEVPSKFGSVEDVKVYLGAFLPGDAEYKAPENMKEVYENAATPASFDSATQWPQCTNIANVRDQSACGSCWAFGSVSSFESRACITNGKDVKYSPEDTAFCMGNGCNGGFSVWDSFKNTGVVTGGDYPDMGTGKTCSAYSFAPCAHHVPATSEYPECPSGEYPSPSCKKECESGYSGSFANDKLHASKTYGVSGEQQIMQELAANGPMYCSFSVYDDFPTYKSGVYKQTSNNYLGGHAVTLVGYGELNGEKYWKVKNSWNKDWGNGGHFLIRRGTNECGIESDVNAGDVSASYTV